MKPETRRRHRFSCPGTVCFSLPRSLRPSTVQCLAVHRTAVGRHGRSAIGESMLESPCWRVGLQFKKKRMYRFSSSHISEAHERLTNELAFAGATSACSPGTRGRNRFSHLGSFVRERNTKLQATVKHTHHHLSPSRDSHSYGWIIRLSQNASF